MANSLKISVRTSLLTHFARLVLIALKVLPAELCWSDRPGECGETKDYIQHQESRFRSNSHEPRVHLERLIPVNFITNVLEII